MEGRAILLNMEKMVISTEDTESAKKVQKNNSTVSVLPVSSVVSSSGNRSALKARQDECR